MSGHTTCPGCQHSYDVPTHFLGKMLRCPQCRTEFRAPVPSAPSDGDPPFDFAERPGAYPDQPEAAPRIDAPHPPLRAETDRPDYRAERCAPEDLPDRLGAGTRAFIIVAAAVLFFVFGVIALFALNAKRSSSPTSAAWKKRAGMEIDQDAIIAKAFEENQDDLLPNELKDEGILEPVVEEKRRVEERKFPEVEAVPVTAPPGLLAVPVPPQEPPVLDVPRSKPSGRALGKSADRIEDVNVVEIDVNVPKSWSCSRIVFHPTENTFYMLETDGTLRKIAMAGLKELRTLGIGFTCECLALSAEGLLVSVTERSEVWVIDRDTLEVKRRIVVPGVSRIVSSPVQSIAFAVERKGRAMGTNRSLCALDLQKGTVVCEYEENGQGADLYRGTASPDGKYLFRRKGPRLQRIRIDETNLTLETATDAIALNSYIEVSADSRWVCLYSEKGGEVADEYVAYVYSISELQKPAYTIRSEARPRTVGFDPKTGRIYTGRQLLTIHAANGLTEKEYILAKEAALISYIVVHPAGNKMLVQTEKKLFLVELDVPQNP